MSLFDFCPSKDSNLLYLIQYCNFAFTSKINLVGYNVVSCRHVNGVILLRFVAGLDSCRSSLVFVLLFCGF